MGFSILVERERVGRQRGERGQTGHRKGKKGKSSKKAWQVTRPGFSKHLTDYQIYCVVTD
jgi:hypothetical protein